MISMELLETQASTNKGPDFLCIGAQKGGTTWLYDNLEKHPSVWVPPVKEIRFFDRICPNEFLLGVEKTDYSPGIKRYKPILYKPSVATLKWLYRFYNYRLSIDWYYQLFENCSANKFSGDITPSYSTLDERGVKFARKVLKSNCKVFVILRNPIERNWSALKMLYRWKNIDIKSLSLEMLRTDLESPSFHLRSNYSQMLHLWISYFGENFRCYFYDDLVENSKKFLSDIQEFIGVKPWVDDTRSVRKSNADEQSLNIPTNIQNYLKEIYIEEIEKLDKFNPGIAKKWLD